MAVHRLEEAFNTLPHDAALFLDTSAWMPCLYYGEQVEKRARASFYIKLFQGRCTGNFKFYSTLEQISEYWNARLHKEHRAWQNGNKSAFGGIGFKDFRNGYPADYNEALAATRAEVKTILSVSSLLNPLERFSVGEIAQAAAEHAVDFNDALYYLICKNYGFALVTEDKDFLPFVNEIDIFTTSKDYP